MKKAILLICILALSSCVVKNNTSSHTSRYSPPPITQKNYIKYMEAIPQIYRDEYKEKYEDSTKDVPYYAYRAINFMAFADNEREHDVIKMVIFNPEYFMYYLKSTQKTIRRVHGFYIDIWRTAINSHIDNEYRHIDFSDALYVVSKEADNLSLNRLLREMKENCSKYFLKSNLYNVQYMGDLYSTYSQSIDLALETTGMSLNEYREKTKKISDQFDNLFYKAEVSLHQALKQ